MSEPAITSEQANWIHQAVSYIAGGLATALGWLWRNAQRKVNGHGKRISELERTSITSEDMNTAITQFRNEVSPQIKSIERNLDILTRHLLDK